jgi:Flp pilus assembly protein TadD
MIPLLLIAASVSTAPATMPNSGELLAGASHAVETNRLDQATVMVSRAVAAGASGPALERVVADLAYARGSYSDALAGYSQLLKATPADPWLLERGAIAALRLGQLETASRLLSIATSGNRASWRVWNACGVLADLKGEWPKADECYQEARRLAPVEAEPINNRGWSLLLRGKWREALGLFEQAKELDPSSHRIANNLELARTSMDANLPEREAGESEPSWAARLNDAGVAAAILGDRQRAASAFVRALEVSGSWYARAANNLEALRSQ